MIPCSHLKTPQSDCTPARANSKMITSRIEKALLNHRLAAFLNFTAAFVIAASVSVDQQSKNFIKLLVVAGIAVTFFCRTELRRHPTERDWSAFAVFGFFYLSVLLSISLNPINPHTLHNAGVMAIGLTSLFIWNLFVVTRFRDDHFWWGITLCATTAGVYSLFDLALHGVDARAGGSAGKAIMFGDIALISGLISVAAIHHFKTYAVYLRYLPHISVLMGIVASMLSGSRGGWVFIPIALVIMLIHQYVLKPDKPAVSPKKLLSTIAVVAGIGAIIVVETNFTQRMEEAYIEIHDYVEEDSTAAGMTSLGQRFEMWRAAIIAFTESPYVGIGPGAFEAYLNKLAANGTINKAVARAIPTETGHKPHSHAHNEYLNTLATRGLLGLGAVLAVFVVSFAKFFNLSRSSSARRSDFGLAGMLLVAGYMVFSISESVLYHMMTTNFFFLTAVSLLFLARKQNLSDSIRT